MDSYKMRHGKLVRYCVLCGVIYLAAVVCWSLLWFLEPVRTALAEMELLSDDYERRVTFYWLGSLLSGSAAGAACLFFLAAFLLEGPVFGTHLQGESKRASKLNWTGRFLLLVVVGTAVLGNHLTLRLYVYPVLFFAVVLLLFVLRVWRWRLSLAGAEPDMPYNPI